MICVNSLPLSEGLITRSRKCAGEVKQSTIDFYVVCVRVLPYVNSMKIDNGKVHMLTNYSNIDKDGIAVNSDHFPLAMEVNIEAAPIKKKKVEIYNFNDTNSQHIFKEITSTTRAFTDCFKDMHEMSKGAENWLKTVKAHCHKTFKKIRIRTKKIRLSAADNMITESNKLVRHGKQKEARILDVKIANIISEEGRLKALMFKKYTDSNSSACLSEMWKLKNCCSLKSIHITNSKN